MSVKAYQDPKIITQVIIKPTHNLTMLKVGVSCEIKLKIMFYPLMSKKALYQASVSWS